MPTSKNQKKTKTKRVSKTKQTTPAVVETAPVVVEAAPVVVVEAVEEAVEEATPVTESVPANEAVTTTSSDLLHSEFAELVATLSGLKNVVSSLTSRAKLLQKKYERELKLAHKSKKRTRVASPNRKPSGFVKPTLITAELASFLGKDNGTLMARTQVTREINQYIRLHNLQDPSNGRIIRPDNALRSLLNVPQSDELTYFNLQRYMSPHFVKTTPEAVSV